MESWLIPAETCIFNEEIKKSRFITLLGHTEGIAAAKAFLDNVKATYPGARHYCWAWVAGRPDDSQCLGFSDDGEPAGTAGKPILAQLQGSGVGEITAVVVRYFGGVKLGTGGLVKAYGGGVQQALESLAVVRKLARVEYRLQCEYALLAGVEKLVADHQGLIIHSDFQASVDLVIALPPAYVAQVNTRLSDLSRGTLHLRPFD